MTVLRTYVLTIWYCSVLARKKSQSGAINENPAVGAYNVQTRPTVIKCTYVATLQHTYVLQQGLYIMLLQWLNQPAPDVYRVVKGQNFMQALSTII